MKKQIISLILIISFLFSFLFIPTGCTEDEPQDDEQDNPDDLDDISEQNADGGDSVQDETDKMPGNDGNDLLTEEFDYSVYYEEVLPPEPSGYVPPDFAIPVNYDALDNELVRAGETEIDSLAFYVGQVLRAYGDETKLETIANLNDFITNTAVTSFNNELTLNHDQGFLVVDAAKVQGITGFLENAPTGFSDVIIESGNEYASIMVVSMDDTDLVNSEKILIQSMTEEKIFGFTTETVTRNNREGELITSLGGGMMQVKEIKAAVTLKNKTGGYAAVLDENGYVRELLEPVAGENGLTIQIPRDAVYVIYSAAPMAVKEFSGEKASFIWWEGEDFTESNFPFPFESYFGNHTEGDFSGLSEGDWLSISNNIRYAPGEPVFARYTVEAAADGIYSLYARAFWHHGPFKWRFNDGDWTERGNVTLLDDFTIRLHLCANWMFLGEVHLSAGTNTFEIEMIPDGDNIGEFDVGYTGGFDCFLLTAEHFVASGNVKPDGEKPNPEAGFFAFNPQYDLFTGDAVMDLRWLNEEYAGQHGFVTSRDGKFYLGNGEEIRFWGVNTGHGTLNAGKGAIDYMAQTLAKRGVNLIRLHGSIFRLDENRRAVISREMLDNIHYFVYAMKNAGIYVKLSVYFPLWHNFGPDTGYGAYSGQHPFALLQFDRDFQAAYMHAVRVLFETTNPYTDTALKDEPTVAFFEIQNEDNYFFYTFSQNNIPNEHMRELEKLFGDWLITKYGAIENAHAAWNFANSRRDDFENGIVGLSDAHVMIGGRNRLAQADGLRIADQIEFLAYNQARFYLRMNDFIKETISSKALVVAGNWTTADPNNLEAVERYTYMAGDVTSRNGYFEPAEHSGDDRVSYSVSEGHWFVSRSGLHSPDILPFKKVQNYGMPSMITEINYPNPNRFRAEFPIMLAAYSALNGINAPTPFALGASWELSASKFGIFTPVTMGQFPAAALMYRLGYVNEAGPVVLETLNVNDLYQFHGSFINENTSLDLLRQQN